jgi:hypothetical protein
MFKEFFSSSSWIQASQYVPGVKSGIDTMLEDDFLYPGDPGEA